MEQKSTMGGRLKALRKKRRVTQEVAADAIGISRAHLAGLETNKDGMSREILSALATYYGTTMDYIESGAAPLCAEKTDDLFDSQEQRAWLLLGSELGSDRRLQTVQFVRSLVAPASAPEPQTSRRPRRK